jgi:hypothetical protein
MGSEEQSSRPSDRRSLLESADIHTVISGTERTSETVTDVIDTEGSAEGVSSADAPGFQAWLFQEDAEPREVAPEELPTLAAEDACFVWVDLSGYVPSDLAQVAQQLDLPEAAGSPSRAGSGRGSGSFVIASLSR